MKHSRAWQAICTHVPHAMHMCVRICRSQVAHTVVPKVSKGRVGAHASASKKLCIRANEKKSNWPPDLQVKPSYRPDPPSNSPPHRVKSNQIKSNQIKPSYRPDFPLNSPPHCVLADGFVLSIRHLQPTCSSQLAPQGRQRSQGTSKANLHTIRV
jgi:hypothetical protein